jgi:predicted DNA-binding ribbon-helix-helix protein
VITKRSLSIQGHRTSISIEDAFWHQLRSIAEREQSSLSQLVARIDADRAPTTNLSSALRLFVLTDVTARIPEGDVKNSGMP